MGFEPTRAEHIGLAVQRLNLSATSSSKNFDVKSTISGQTLSNFLSRISMNWS